MTAEEATEDVVNNQLMEVSNLKDKGLLDVCENIDVFCEKGVFNVDQTERILKAGKAAGLSINFHGEELSCLGSAEVRKTKNPIFMQLLIFEHFSFVTMEIFAGLCSRKLRRRRRELSWLPNKIWIGSSSDI